MHMHSCPTVKEHKNILFFKALFRQTASYNAMADLASICSVENIVLGKGKEKRLRKNKLKR
jgi:hypothetical protein